MPDQIICGLRCFNWAGPGEGRVLASYCGLTPDEIGAEYQQHGSGLRLRVHLAPCTSVSRGECVTLTFGRYTFADAPIVPDVADQIMARLN